MNFCKSGKALACPLFNSSSSKNECIKASPLIPKMLIVTSPIIKPITKNTTTGNMHEFNFSLKYGTSVIRKYPIIALETEIKIVPIVVNRLPIAAKVLNLPKFLTINANPSHAAVQKLSPFNAICIYACLFINSIYLPIHPIQHCKHEMMHLKHLLSDVFPAVLSTLFLTLSSQTIMNLTIATINAPKAKLPK